MQRRKLVADIISEGVVKVTSYNGERLVDEIDKLLINTASSESEAQKFVLDGSETYSTYKLLNKTIDPEILKLFKAPYSHFWVEEANRDARFVHFGGVTDEVLPEDRINFPDVDFEKNKLIRVLHFYELSEENKVQLMPVKTSLVEGDYTKVHTNYLLDETQMPSDYKVFAKHVSKLGIMALTTLFTTLNIKKATVSEVVKPPEKLNKARKRKNKTPLQGYTYVRMLAKEETCRTENSSFTPKVYATHLRRGHFKHCKTGTYWWNPTIVGKEELTNRKAYVVD